MKNWIMNFIKDERGAETAELSIATVVVAGGSVAGFTALKGKLADKNTELLDKLDDSVAN